MCASSCTKMWGISVNGVGQYTTKELDICPIYYKCNSIPAMKNIFKNQTT